MEGIEYEAAERLPTPDQASWDALLDPLLFHRMLMMKEEPAPLPAASVVTNCNAAEYKVNSEEATTKYLPGSNADL